MKRLQITLLFALLHLVTWCPTVAECLTLRKIDFEAIRQERIISRLMYTFRIIESGDDYTKRGLSGEYGAYQFLPSTWTLYCLEFYGKELDIRVDENQDRVAYLKLKKLLDNGFTEDQIASFWNCGSPEWEGKVGVNKHGVAYDVPSYVEKFKQIIEGT